MHRFCKDIRAWLVFAPGDVAASRIPYGKSMNMCIFNRALAACLVIAAFSFGCDNTVEAKDSGSSPASFGAACQQAAASQKLVALEFFSEMSAESQILRDRTLSQPKIAQLLAEKFVFVSLEQKENEALAQKYEINRFPTVVLIKTDGTEIDRMGRWGNATQFEAFLRNGLQGRSEISELTQRVKAASDSVSAHLALADAYMRRNQETEALQEYRWCMEHGQEINNWEYLQNSKKLIRGLVSLRVHTPAAKVALHDFRKRVDAECQIKPGRERYLVLFSCNEALREPNRNLDLYRALPATSPLRGQLLASIFPELIRRRMYKDAVSALDLEDFVNAAYIPITMRVPGKLDDQTEPSSEPKESVSDGNGTIKSSLLDRAVAAVEALLATGQMAKAQRIAGRVLDSDDSRLLRIRLLEAGRRSGVAEIDAFSRWVKAYNLPEEKRSTIQ